MWMGLVRGNPGNAGSGGLIRDYNGDLLIGYATYLGITSSVYAEANAIAIGLKLAQEFQSTSVWLESDYEILVKILNGLIDPPWGIYYLTEDIMALIKVLNVCQIS